MMLASYTPCHYAITGKARLIITFNVKHFPKNKLEKWDIEAQHPDDFIADLLYLHT
jgi:hypothetical protein